MPLRNAICPWFIVKHYNEILLHVNFTNIPNQVSFCSVTARRILTISCLTVPSAHNTHTKEWLGTTLATRTRTTIILIILKFKLQTHSTVLL